MIQKIIYKSLSAAVIILSLAGCQANRTPVRMESKSMPASFTNSQDSATIARMDWKDYFSDHHLVALIDSALKKNQELNITMQEIEILKNEVRARRGEYLPTVGIGAAAGFEKDGRYTRHGSVDENGEILPGRRFPDP